MFSVSVLADVADMLPNVKPAGVGVGTFNSHSFGRYKATGWANSRWLSNSFKLAADWCQGKTRTSRHPGEYPKGTRAGVQMLGLTRFQMLTE
jgi:hypothetical protein